MAGKRKAKRSRNPVSSDEKRYARLKTELLKLEGGRKEVAMIEDTLHPEVIFSLPPGPERTRESASLVKEVEDAIRDLMHESGYVRRKMERTEHVRRSSTKAGSKAGPTVARRGTFERFKYKIWLMPPKGTLRGGYVGEITREGRQLMPVEGAPYIQGHPQLFGGINERRFGTAEPAETAVRRVINEAIIWRTERGIPLKEKARRTVRARGFVAGRRGAGETEAMRKTEARAIREEEIRRKREERRQAVKGQGRPTRRSKEARVERGQRIEYIPKGRTKNPSGNAQAQADSSLREYAQHFDRWQNSVAKGKPNFDALFKAYDAIENARANYYIADITDMQQKADKAKAKLRGNISKFLADCYRATKNPTNPTRVEHAKIGKRHLKESEKYWNKYRKSWAEKDLLDAYKHLEMAHENLKQAGDKKALEQAMRGIKAARAELKERMVKD